MRRKQKNKNKSTEHSLSRIKYGENIPPSQKKKKGVGVGSGQ